MLKFEQFEKANTVFAQQNISILGTFCYVDINLVKLIDSTAGSKFSHMDFCFIFTDMLLLTDPKLLGITSS